MTAFQVFQDVCQKATKALEFYTQLFGIITPLSKGIDNIEMTEVERQKELEKLKPKSSPVNFEEDYMTSRYSKRYSPEYTLPTANTKPGIFWMIYFFKIIFRVKLRIGRV